MKCVFSSYYYFDCFRIVIVEDIRTTIDMDDDGDSHIDHRPSDPPPPEPLDHSVASFGDLEEMPVSAPMPESLSLASDALREWLRDPERSDGPPGKLDVNDFGIFCGCDGRWRVHCNTCARTMLIKHSLRLEILRYRHWSPLATQRHVRQRCRDKLC